MAQDETASIEVVLHAVSKLLGYDFVVLLQPTSPLRTAADIDGAIACCLDGDAPSCVSVTVAECSPCWMYSMGKYNRLKPVLHISRENIYQRQKWPKVYQLNGAVYVAKVGFLSETRSFIGAGTVGYVMPAERSCDIDTSLDFDIAEVLLKKR